jgi:hypothetical protein
MPLWAYHLSPFSLAILMIAVIELVSILGLILTRRLLLPRLRLHEGVNDAISGTVQAIGVFYGITVGLIAVGVWDTNSSSTELVSREAAAIGVLYRDLGGYPEPMRSSMQNKLKEYTVIVIEQVWPSQKLGHPLNVGKPLLDELQSTLYAFGPSNTSQSAIHGETLKAFNNLIEARRLRMGAVDSGLSDVMWAVIWLGAVISISVAYLYKIEDLKLHIILVALMSGFLAILLFMIVINDRPFFGYASIPPDPYKLVLETAMQGH